MKHFTFIHNPRTGGETIETLLNIDYQHHKHRTIFNENIDLDGFTFVFVRDPIDRLCSWYHHLRKHLYTEKYFQRSNKLNDISECYSRLRADKKKWIQPDKHRTLAEANTFNSWVKIMLKDIDLYADTAGPLGLQYNYVYNKPWETGVNKVARFENYTDELSTILSTLGKSNIIKSIEKTNYSIRDDIFLDGSTCDSIFKYFYNDYTLLEYKMECNL